MMEQVQIVFDEEKKTLKLIYVRRDAWFDCFSISLNGCIRKSQVQKVWG